MNELWEKYEQLMFEISSYRLVISTTSLDADTIAKEKGRSYRNARLAYMQGELYSKSTSEELYDVLVKLHADTTLDDTKKRIVQWHLESLEKLKKVDKQLYVDNSVAIMEGNQAWLQAKANNDYESFKEPLKKVIESKKNILAAQGECSYEACLQEYEPGITLEEYERFFSLIKEKLVPFIAKIQTKPQYDNAFNFAYYPKDEQKKMMKDVMEYIDFDFKAGVMLESEHPYSNSLSKNDNRFTNHYYENNLQSAIFSVIHESGHLNYNHNIDDRLAETFVFNNMSAGMHESQSRLFENYLGRNMHFWDNLYPKVQKRFYEQLKDVTQLQFYYAMNRCEATPVRIQADELTYPLHILIRYEIEKSFFDGTLDYDQLPEIWNEKYQQYLGITPPSNAKGVLQDMHWGNGLVGYFPTYALGSAYAAQFMHALEKDLDYEKALSENRFTDIKDWLREHIHQYGGLYSPKEMIALATGEPFNPEYYIEYLISKFSKIYGIEE